MMFRTVRRKMSLTVMCYDYKHTANGVDDILYI